MGYQIQILLILIQIMTDVSREFRCLRLMKRFKMEYQESCNKKLIWVIAKLKNTDRNLVFCRTCSFGILHNYMLLNRRSLRNS